MNRRAFANVLRGAAACSSLVALVACAGASPDDGSGDGTSSDEQSTTATSEALLSRCVTHVCAVTGERLAAYVTEESYLRSSPSDTASRITRVTAGDIVYFHGVPQCPTNGYYRVDTLFGYRTGWIKGSHLESQTVCWSSGG